MDRSGARVGPEGGVRASAVVGDHGITVTAHRSVVTVVGPGQWPRPERRTCPAVPAQGCGPDVLVGRERELAAIARAVADGRPVQVHGPPGSGKSALLRHAARTLAAEGRQVLLLSAAHSDPEDLLQDVYEACYDTSGHRPHPAELRRLLSGLRGCLVLDDLECPAEALDTLLETAPDATFLFSCAERALWRGGSALALGGLAYEDALTLLAARTGREVPAADLPAAQTLWRATAGSPLWLVRAAAAARLPEDGPPHLPRPAQLRTLLPTALQRLTGPARDALAVLALPGAGIVDPCLLAQLVGPSGASAGPGRSAEADWAASRAARTARGAQRLREARTLRGRRALSRRCVRHAGGSGSWGLLLRGWRGIASRRALPVNCRRSCGRGRLRWRTWRGGCGGGRLPRSGRRVKWPGTVPW